MKIGVAAYKAVELDDLLDDGPVQHREVQGSESHLFESYFPEIKLMSGGIASGFRHVKPEDYEPRLFHVKRTKKSVKSHQVACNVKSMNVGDVFVLDAGLKVYCYQGPEADAFEKMKGGTVVANLCSGRAGKSVKAEIDDNFWKILKGTEKDVAKAVPKEKEVEIQADKLTLFRLSDASGEMKFTKEAEGEISRAQLDSNDVFILDAGPGLFVWVGKLASKLEKSKSMAMAEKFLKDTGKPHSTPISRIVEGQVSIAFDSLLKVK